MVQEMESICYFVVSLFFAIKTVKIVHKTVISTTIDNIGNVAATSVQPFLESMSKGNAGAPQDLLKNILDQFLAH